MSQGAVPKTAPVGWVFLDRHREDGITIRWRRGELVAYVFAGKQMDTYPDEPLRTPVLATIPVSSSGWTDFVEIRQIGQRWLRTRTA